MLFMLYHRKTRPTGRVIARALGFRKFGIRAPGFPVDVVLRWGNSTPLPAAVEINSAEAIRRAANKLTTYRILREADIPVPRFSTHRDDIEGVCFARTKFGSKGRGIRVVRDGEDAPGYDVYTQFVESSREFRLHVVGGEVVRVQGKYLDHPDHPMARYIKNHETGYRFRAPRQALRDTRTTDAIRAVQALGLDFGAVDLILTDGGEHYVLEVNTGPSCSPLTATAYVTGLARLIAERSEGRYEPVPLLHHLDALVGDADEPRMALAGVGAVQ